MRLKYIEHGIMESQQNYLFHSESGSRKKSCAGDTLDSSSYYDIIKPDLKQPAASPDGHLTDILLDYITHLPDNATRKHIARQLINFIIKSANL